MCRLWKFLLGKADVLTRYKSEFKIDDGPRWLIQNNCPWCWLISILPQCEHNCERSWLFWSQGKLVHSFPPVADLLKVLPQVKWSVIKFAFYHHSFSFHWNSSTLYQDVLAPTTRDCYKAVLAIWRTTILCKWPDQQFRLSDIHIIIIILTWLGVLSDEAPC